MASFVMFKQLALSQIKKIRPQSIGVGFCLSIQPSAAELSQKTDAQPCNLALSRSLTTAGLAWPLEAFITWPTKKPNSLSLPPR